MIKISSINVLSLGLAFSILILLSGITWSIKSSSDLYSNISSIEQAYQAIENIKTIEVNLSIAESNARAYYLTKDLRYREVYKRSVTKLKSDLSAIDQVITKNEKQIQNIEKYKSLISERISVFENVIANKDERDSLFFRSVTEKILPLNFSIDKVESDIIEEEKKILAERQRSSYSSLSVTTGFDIILGVTAIIVSGLIIKLIRKDIIKRNINEKELIKLNENKNKFFSIISHDLRGPIHAIANLTGMLINYKKNSIDINEYLFILNSSAKKTANLIDNLLTWSRTQMNKIEFKPEVFNLSEMLKGNIIEIVNAAAEKNIDMKYSFSGDYLVKADKKMIETVTRNLLWNALKFTQPTGTISISIVSLRNEYIVEIADTGIGIPDSLAKKLFSLDPTLSRPGTANEQGTGLGLILCKEFIEKNGGRIWVKTKEGEGSTFCYSLKKENVSTGIKGMG